MKEQLNLFGNDKDQSNIVQKPVEVPKENKNEQITYLPQAKWEESYIDIGSLSDLEKVGKSCNSCPLRATCKQVIFGEGRDDAKIMFIGEGPGQDEDKEGRPFVGRAGQLLDKIFLASEIPRPDTYITNVIKCRPPGNRLPKPDEVNVCQNYLEAQIRLLQPKIIVCLGALATQTVIEKNARITRTRGRWFSRHGIRMMATFHPAALLRNEDYKRPTWEDFKLIRDEFKKL